MHECAACEAEYPSAFAAAECEETDRREELNARRWHRAHPNGR